jgi:hypothetical protein
VGGLLIFVLAFWGVWNGAAVLAGLSGSSAVVQHTPVSAASPTIPASQPTATATTKPTDPDWHTYTFPSYGFQVDISTVLYPQHSLLINNGAGEQTDWIYQGAALGSSLRSASAETTVVVEYSTAIADINICPSGGTPMSIGSGIRAYETASVPPDSNGPAASQPYVRINLVTGGVAIQIELDGQGDPNTFFNRYGPIWQHMLASFATFTPLQPQTMHPCG